VVMMGLGVSFLRFLFSATPFMAADEGERGIFCASMPDETEVEGAAVAAPDAVVAPFIVDVFVMLVDRLAACVGVCVRGCDVPVLRCLRFE
jgi:hypothetical protein